MRVVYLGIYFGEMEVEVIGIGFYYWLVYFFIYFLEGWIMDRMIGKILDGKGIDGIYGKIDELLMD